MPNWIVGDLKVRGTKKEIRRFITEGLEAIPFSILGIKDSNIETKVVGDEDFFRVTTNGHCFYIKGTRRHFIRGNEIEVDFYTDKEDGKEVVVLEGFEAAWYIEAEQLAEISKEYNIDFKILGFERGMEFNQDVEIVNGEVVKDDEVKFDDYWWECIRPHIGG